MPTLNLDPQPLKSHFLNYKQARVHILEFGKGAHPIIAIAGFADRASLFSSLEPALASHYTTYVIDLPFHGKTEWPHAFFNKEDVLRLVELLLKEINAREFSLMGYSFGGRICQHLFLAQPNRIKQMFLIAPDGMRKKYFGRADQMPAIVRYLGKKIVNRPNWVFYLNEKLEKLGLSPPYLGKFLKIHLATERRRRRLFGYWDSIRFFKLKIEEVKSKIQETKLPVHLYFGARDQIIPVEQALAFKKGLPTVHLHVMEEAHDLINENLSQLMKKTLGS